MVQASLHVRAISPEPSLLAHISSESRGTFRQKARFLAPLNGWACAVIICHDRMLEDTKSLDGAQIIQTPEKNSLTHPKNLNNLVSPRLGKRELVYALLMHLFVYFLRINFFPFSLPLGVRS